LLHGIREVGLHEAFGGIAVGTAMVSGRALANGPTSGDIVILQLLCAAEQIESNLL
jgi:hypothetical protein